MNEKALFNRTFIIIDNTRVYDLLRMQYRINRLDRPPRVNTGLKVY